METGAQDPRYEVVFFDLYGTLIDIRTDEQSEAAWQALYDCVCMNWAPHYGSLDEMRERFDQLEAREMVHQANRAIVRDGWGEFDILPVYRSLLMNRDDEAGTPIGAAAGRAEKAAWAFRQGSTSMIRLYPGALDMIEASAGRRRRGGAAEQRAGMLHEARTGDDRFGERAGRRDYLQRRENPQACPASLYMLALDREFVTRQARAHGGQRRTQTTSSAPMPRDLMPRISARRFRPPNDPAASEHAVCSFTGADYDGSAEIRAERVKRA